MLKYTLEFIAFLKENNAYDKFKKNCVKHRFKTHPIELYDFLNPLVQYERKGYNTLNPIINVSFVWNETQEGYRFWENLHRKWIKKIDELSRIKTINDKI